VQPALELAIAPKKLIIGGETLITAAADGRSQNVANG